MTETSLTIATPALPIDAKNHQHWLLVATDHRSSTGRRYSALEVFRIRLEDLFWGCGSKTPYRRRLRQGDRAAFYLGGSGGHQAVASCSFASALVELPLEERLRLRHGDDALDMPCGVYLEEVEVWPRPVSLTSEVRARLSFLEDKVRWGSSLQGTFIPIAPPDFKYLRACAGLDGPPAASDTLPVVEAESSRRNLVEPYQTQTSSLGMESGILLGHVVKTGKPLNWAPLAEKNPHLLVVGMSGTGKTETLRAIVRELSRRGIPALIFDRHDEFRSVADVCLDLGSEVALNPLELLGRRPHFVTYEVLQILQRLLQLGVQQLAMLRTAIREAYRKRGIVDTDPVSWLSPPPTFADVRQVLAHLAVESGPRQIVVRLSNRLDFLFDLEAFGTRTYIPFNTLLRQTTAIRFSALPSDDAKNVVAEFLLRRLWDYLWSQGQVSNLRLFTVVDEAHHLAYERSPLDPLLREARKYGLGLLLASQRPHDFAEPILANVATTVVLQCTFDRDARFMAQHINCGPSEVKNLVRRGEALVKFASGPYPLHAQIWPAFART